MDNMNAGLVRVTKDGLGLEPDLAREWAITMPRLTPSSCATAQLERR
jgi:hypothetical protein